MPITLTPEQEAWLLAHVQSGAFASVEEAARRLIDDRIAELDAATKDPLDWAKPLLDEARASLARGDGFSLDEHRARNLARRASRRG